MNKTLNINREEFKTQIRTLVQEIKSQTQDNLIDGIIEEIATNRIIYQEILQRLDLIDNQLVINNIELPVYVPSEVADELTIMADFPLSAENGFYELEYDQHGRTMRWTGLSNSFYFDLCFNRLQEKEIVLEILSPHSEQNITDMQCFIDDAEVNLSITKEQGICQLKAVVKAQKNNKNTKISFVFPELIKPSEIDPNQTDNRNLGVVFYKLLVKKV